MRVVRFPGETWPEIEALPQPMREKVQSVIFHLVEEPIPTLADPFPDEEPLPGAFRLHLPTDGATIWYTLHTAPDGTEVISIQRVRADA